MRAVGITEFGGPEVLHVVELPDPEPGPEEVRIRVRAATVNPTDLTLRNGGRAERLKDVPPPHVPGMEAAGEIELVGDAAATDLRPGERVMAIVLPLGARGAYAERVVVPAESAVRVPDGATDAEATTLPMNGLTARLALDVLALGPGRTLGVTGAAGAVGGYTVQLAKTEGLRVVADAAPEDEALVRQLGADLVVVRGEGFAEAVRAQVPEGVDGLVDAGLLDAAAAAAVRDGGAVITLRGYEGAGARRGDLAFHPVYVRTYAREHTKLERLRALASAGSLSMRVAHVLPAADAAESHRMLEAGGVRGRIVLRL